MRNAYSAAKLWFKPFVWLKPLATLSLLATLAACSGGADTEQNADTATTGALSINYIGPAPSSTDVQAFKNEFWVNVVSSSRCGGC
ncbi:MAG: hypothetical protein AB7U99_03795, partial [Steroidobacteraceae bacterium]